MDIPFTFALDEETQITLLAASAPKQIPGWFKPRLPEERPAVETFKKWVKDHKCAIKDVDDGDGEPSDIYVREWLVEHENMDFETAKKLANALVELDARERKAFTEWNDNFKMEKLLQWPIHYAREVLKRKLIF